MKIPFFMPQCMTPDKNIKNTSHLMIHRVFVWNCIQGKMNDTQDYLQFPMDSSSTHRVLQEVSLFSFFLSFLWELKSKAALSRPRSSLIFSQPYKSPYLSITWQEKQAGLHTDCNNSRFSVFWRTPGERKIGGISQARRCHNETAASFCWEDEGAASDIHWTQKALLTPGLTVQYV